MEKKRLLFVINTMGCGGAETALINLLSSLSPSEYEVSLYVLLDQGELISRLPEHVRLLNRRFFDMSVLDKKGSRQLAWTVLRKAFCHGAVLRRLPYMLRQGADMLKRGAFDANHLLWQMVADGSARFDEQYDLAVAYLEGGATYYVANHVKARRKAAFVHVDYSQAGYSPALDDHCYDKIDRVFAVSDEVKQAFEDVYSGRDVRVMHNKLNPRLVQERAAEAADFDPGYDGMRLVTVGRLVPQKALDVSIDAMALLKKHGVKARWYVLGEGPDRAKLEQQIASLGLSEDFLLLGARTNPYPYFQAADLYVHASRFEGKSIAVQEAQILGKPILVSDCSGNREQVASGVDGELCQLTAEDICAHIERMLGDPALCRSYGVAAQQRAQRLDSEIEQLLEMAL